MFGKLENLEIPLDAPKDEAKLAELELIYQTNYGDIPDFNATMEAKNLLDRLDKELKKAEIMKIKAKLELTDETDENYKNLLNELNQLLKS